MALTFVAMLLSVGLLAAMLAIHEVGRRLGHSRNRRGLKDDGATASAVGAAVFALLGLLLAFTFSGAASRFEARRHLITTEANAIGTAYLRLDLLPADAQPALRRLFRDYLELRILASRERGDANAAAIVAADALSLQKRIWAAAVAASGRAEVPPAVRQLVVPALNDMIDISTTRAAAAENHPPVVIPALLVGLCLLSALIVGHSAATGSRNSWFYPVVFSATMALTLYVVIDLEYPRQGLIRVDAADKTLSDLRPALRGS
jgi:hypothetical protein